MLCCFFVFLLTTMALTPVSLTNFYKATKHKGRILVKPSWTWKHVYEHVKKTQRKAASNKNHIIKLKLNSNKSWNQWVTTLAEKYYTTIMQPINGEHLRVTSGGHSCSSSAGSGAPFQEFCWPASNLSIHFFFKSNTVLWQYHPPVTSLLTLKRRR